MIAAAVTSAVGAAPALAAITARTSIETRAGASRIVVKLSSASPVAVNRRPRAVSLVARGRTYRLTRARGSAAAVALGTWRSAAYKGAAGAAVRALGGKRATLRLRSARGSTSVATTVAGATTVAPGAPVAPAPATPPAAPPGTPALFAAPGADRTGNEAYEAIKGYLADSRFTDCVSGWPNCAVEQRYGHFADGTQWYCRLTSSSGSDIRSVGGIQQISGAEQKADGSWGVEYHLLSYGNTVFYSWRVSATGAVTGLYWGPGQSPQTGPAQEAIGPLQWVRGARDCSY